MRLPQREHRKVKHHLPHQHRNSAVILEEGRGLCPVKSCTCSGKPLTRAADGLSSRAQRRIRSSLYSLPVAVELVSLSAVALFG